jgi:hypothetical protein
MCIIWKKKKKKKKKKHIQNKGIHCKFKDGLMEIESGIIFNVFINDLRTHHFHLIYKHTIKQIMVLVSTVE